MAISKNLKEFLEKNSVDYDVETHREVFTAQEVAASEHITGYEFAKVVMLRCDGEMVMAVVPAPHDVDPEKVKKLGFREVELADEKDFEKLFPDCDTGAMPPFGNLYNITYFVDEFFRQEEEIVFNSGTHTQTVKVKKKDFEKLIEGDRYADISVGPTQ